METRRLLTKVTVVYSINGSRIVKKINALNPGER